MWYHCGTKKVSGMALGSHSQSLDHLGSMMREPHAHNETTEVSCTHAASPPRFE